MHGRQGWAFSCFRPQAFVFLHAKEEHPTVYDWDVEAMRFKHGITIGSDKHRFAERKPREPLRPPAPLDDLSLAKIP